MKVGESYAGLGALNQLSMRSGSTAKNISQLASGLKINSAADDAAGLAISEQFINQIKGLSMVIRNVQDGVALATVAEDAIGQSQEIVGRMRGLALQARNNILTAEDRKAIAAEYGQLSEELDNVSQNIEVNGQKLFDSESGKSNDFTFQVGADKNQTSTLSLNSMSTKALILDKLDFSTAAGASNALAALDKASTKLSSSKTSIGAFVNSMESASRNFDISITNITQAKSRIRDLDMAQGTTELTKKQILQNASIATLAIGNHSSQAVYALIYS